MEKERTEENRKPMENYAQSVEEIKNKGVEACATEKVFESQAAKEEYADFLLSILDGSAMGEAAYPEDYKNGWSDAYGNFHYRTKDGGENMEIDGVVLEK